MRIKYIGGIRATIGQGSLVALLLISNGIGIGGAKAQTVEYIHTDLLGTPTAVTDSNRVVIERSEYEPFGKLLNRPLSDGLGFTGHVQDMATGMTYMQQRYYDPGIGRFLSVDPVTANSGTGANFNRYWYANDNPYRFADPDGRMIMDNYTRQHPNCQSDKFCRFAFADGGGSESKKPTTEEPAGRRWDGQIPTTPNGGLKGAVGERIKSFLDTPFEKRAFDRYWYGDGDYTLTSAEFNGLVKSSAGMFAYDSQTFFKGGEAFLAEKFNFYGVGFAGSIGSGWLISAANGQKVGFYDRYDFNSKNWGSRSTYAEIKTRLVDPVGAIFGAQPYDITYGVYTELP